MSEIITVHTEILVIGGGAAGMAAAASASSHGSRVILCDERPYLGGILPQCIHSGFGLGRYGREMTGPEYCRLEEQKLLSSDVDYYTQAHVISVDSDRSALVSSRNGLMRIRFSECILATGCMEKHLFSLPVAGTRPAGIYTAGEAQELVNLGHRDIGRKIFVLGSGDVGMIMARRFTLLGKTVVGIAEQRDELGGLKRKREECIYAYAIPVYLRSTIAEIHGFPELTGITLRHLDTGTEERIECDTLITAIGLIPDRSLAEHLISDGGFPAWLHLCGNADRVHEIADSVSAEGTILGRELSVGVNHES